VVVVVVAAVLEITMMHPIYLDLGVFCAAMVEEMEVLVLIFTSTPF